jgi:hypothetical protein
VRQHIALPEEAQIIEVSDLLLRPEKLRARFLKWPPEPIGFTSDLAAFTYELRTNPPEGDIGLAVSPAVIASQELRKQSRSSSKGGARVDIIVGPSD